MKQLVQGLSRSIRFPIQFGSLRSQLIFWNVLSISLLLGGLGVVCRYITYSFMMQSVDRELEHGIGMFLHSPRRPTMDRDRPPPREDGGMPFGSPVGPGGPPREGPGPDGPRDPGHRPGRPPDANNPYRPHVFNSELQSDWPSDQRTSWDKAALARSLRGETVWSVVLEDGDPVRVLTSPGFDHLRQPGAVQIAYPLKEVYRAVSGIDMALLLLLPVGLLGAWWMGSALTNRILIRVHRMSAAAAGIGPEDFAQRLPVTGRDEFSELATTFNGMLGRLDLAYEEQKGLLDLQRRFTADASHELKTPLTVVKGSTSLALTRSGTDPKSRETFEEIDRAADTMSQLVQDLLLLARSDSGQMGRDRIEISLRDVLEQAHAQLPRKDCAAISMQIEPEDLSVTGNEPELVRLFRNLLDNAIQYDPVNGRVSVLAHHDGDRVVATIQDSGPGIAPEHLPHLGERFYRIDTARARQDGGTGLGLSICKGIVDAHGGNISFNSRVGEGTCVTVVLPHSTSES